MDTSIKDSTLQIYRDLFQECKSKNKVNTKFEEMQTYLDRMEYLGNIHTDIASFQGALLQEDLFMKFSLAYADFLAESYTAPSGQSIEENDRRLLNQNLDALRNSLQSIEEQQQVAFKKIQNSTADSEKRKDILQKLAIEQFHQTDRIKKDIHNLIELGMSSENYPTYLRIQIETGLDKAIEGSTIIKENYAEEYELAKIQNLSPYHINRSQKIWESYLTLSEKAPLSYPESIDIELDRKRIEHEFQPFISQWQAITEKWTSILLNLSYWAASQTSRAPYVEPWVIIPSMENRKEAIEFTKHTGPGTLQQEIRQLKENFDMDFYDIFAHETFIHAIQDNRIEFSQELVIHLIQDVFPNCNPRQFLPNEIIQKNQAIFEAKRYYKPGESFSDLAYKENFIQKYGLETWKIISNEPKADHYHKHSIAEHWQYETFLNSIQS